MASVSSILRSAQSRRRQLQADEDKLVQFEWESSYKTTDDLRAYLNHFNSRMSTTSDTGELITYQTKMRSANRAFTSAEIQRQTIRIMEGGGTLYDKQAAVGDLYMLAQNNQDYDTAQNLYQQYLSLQDQILNQQARGQALAGKMASAQAKTVNEYVNKLIYGVGDKDRAEEPDSISIKFLSDTLETYGEEAVNANSAAVTDYVNQLRAQEGLAPIGQAGLFDVLKSFTDEVASTYKTAAEQLAGTSAGEKMLESYLKFTGQAADGQETTVDFGGRKWTYKEINQEYEAQLAGYSRISFRQEGGKTKIVDNELTDYVWAVNQETGQYYVQGIYEQFADQPGKYKAKDALGNVITDINGKELSITEALDNMGIQYSQSNGRFIIQNPGGIAGISGGEGLEFVISSDGTLRAVASDPDGNQRLYKLSFANGGTDLITSELGAGSAEATELRATDPQAIAVTKALVNNQPQNADLLAGTRSGDLRVTNTLGGSRLSATDILRTGQIVSELNGLGLGGIPFDVTNPLSLANISQQAATARAALQSAATPQMPNLPAQITQTPQRTVSGGGLNQTPVQSNFNLSVLPLPTINDVLKVTKGPAQQPTVSVNTQPRSGQQLKVSSNGSQVNFLGVR